jgi:hypothetical protein
MIDPSQEQLLEFYRVARRVVLLSSYIAFVELGSDRTLYIHISRYESPESRILIKINPDGEVLYE